MTTVPTTTTAAATRPASVTFRSFDAEVARIARLSDHFVRVTFTGADLAHFHAAGFDQRIKIVLPIEKSGLSTFPRTGDDWYTRYRELPDHERCPMRTYTVRGFRDAGTESELDVDFVVHGDSGPATRWVARASIGDPVVIVGPDVRTLSPGGAPVAGVEFRPADARRLLLAGDETAAPALCAIVEQLDARAEGQVFIEVPTAGDILDVTAPAGVNVTWLPRGDRLQYVHGAALDRAVRAWVGEMVVEMVVEIVVEPHETKASGGTKGEPDATVSDQASDDLEILWEVPDSAASHRDLYAWIAGEAACITGLRRFLVRDTGLEPADVAFMGYWRAGRNSA